MIRGTIENALSLTAGVGFSSWSNNTFTYSYYENVDDLTLWYAGEEAMQPGRFLPFTQVERKYVAEVLFNLEDIADLEFNFLETPQHSQLTFGGITSSSSYYGYASMGMTPTRSADGIVDADSGDVWLATLGRQISNVSYNSSGRGDAFYKVLPHEIGHALGLRHPHVGADRYTAIPGYSDEENSMQFTIMSYRNHADAGDPAYSFQLYDIAALHRLYGRGEANADDTTYNVFHEHEPTDGSTHIGGALSGSFSRIISIWDSSGDDTIDASQSPYKSSIGSAGVLIDLRPGFFSSIAEDSELSIAGMIVLPGLQNVSVAFGAYIENAIGSARDDLLIGNLLSNRLRGGIGSDLIFAEGRLRPDATGDDVTDGDYNQIGEQGYSQVGVEAAEFVSDPSLQLDRLFGDAGDDQLWGGRGDDELDGGEGGDLLYGGEGHDKAAYGSGGGGVDLALAPGTGAPDARIEANPNAPDPGAEVQLLIRQGSDTDTLVDMEEVQLTAYSDTLRLTGDPNAYDAGDVIINMGLAPIGFGQDVVDASALTKGIYFNLGSGSIVGLDETSDVTSLLGWASVLAGVMVSGSDIRITGANSVVGTNYSDVLRASSGDAASGEGYSALYGGLGNDLLISSGWESHLYSGAGADRFDIGAGAWVEDATAHDRVSYFGIPLYGGAKQWWMEANTAYWAPFTTVLAAFPVAGASILTAAAFFIDMVTMKFARYKLDAQGNLLVDLWGQSKPAVIRDYNLDLDSGLGAAGLSVFMASAADGNGGSDGSESRLRGFVNLALYSGFGAGLPEFDPLVLDLDGDGFELTSEGNSRVYFEFDGDGFGERTGWVRGDDGLLARDANGNGAIDDVTELFGNRTQSVQDSVRLKPDRAQVIGEGVLLDRRLPAAMMLLDYDLQPLQPLERIAGR